MVLHLSRSSPRTTELLNFLLHSYSYKFPAYPYLKETLLKIIDKKSKFSHFRLPFSTKSINFLTRCMYLSWLSDVFVLPSLQRWIRQLFRYQILSNSFSVIVDWRWNLVKKVDPWLQPRISLFKEIFKWLNSIDYNISKEKNQCAWSASFI